MDVAPLSKKNKKNTRNRIEFKKKILEREKYRRVVEPKFITRLHHQNLHIMQN